MSKMGFKLLIPSIQYLNGCPHHLSTDHDPLFRYHQWQANLRILGIEEIKTVPETPWSHPFIERAIGTVRGEFLDGTLFWGKRDLESKLAEFVIYYNDARTHSSLTGLTPIGMSGNDAISKIDLRNYKWKDYCGGRFSIPVAA